MEPEGDVGASVSVSVAVETAGESSTRSETPLGFKAGLAVADESEPEASF